MNKPQSYQATIHSLDYSPNRQVVFLRMKLSNVGFSFQEGQFIMIQCVIGGVTVKKAYSIATTMKEYKELQTVGCIIKLVPGGVFTTYVFESMGVGETVEIIGPLGHMTLPQDTQNKHIIFLSVGSGLSPIYGMYQSLLYSGQYKSIINLYGEKSTEWMVPETLKTMEQNHDNVTTRICLSRQSDSRLRNGYLGYVGQCLTEIMTKYSTKMDKQLDMSDNQLDMSDNELDNFDNYSFYLCGRPDIVDELVKQLESYNIPKKCIVFEKY